MTITNELTNKIIRFINESGIGFAFRHEIKPVRGRRVRPEQGGVLDIVGCTSSGRYLEIDIKTGKDKLRLSQIKHIEKIERLGALTMEVKDFDDFLRQAQERRMVK